MKLKEKMAKFGVKKMITCDLCGIITKSKEPTGKFIAWAWIMEKEKKIGKKILYEKKVCMKHNGKVLIK